MEKNINYICMGVEVCVCVRMGDQVSVQEKKGGGFIFIFRQSLVPVKSLDTLLITLSCVMFFLLLHKYTDDIRNGKCM